jgi:hypothetical protein
MAAPDYEVGAELRLRGATEDRCVPIHRTTQLVYKTPGQVAILIHLVFPFIEYLIDFNIKRAIDYNIVYVTVSPYISSEQVFVDEGFRKEVFRCNVAKRKKREILRLKPQKGTSSVSLKKITVISWQAIKCRMRPKI